MKFVLKQFQEHMCVFFFELIAKIGKNIELARVCWKNKQNPILVILNNQHS